MQKVQKKTLQLYEGIIIAYIAYFFIMHVVRS